MQKGMRCIRCRLRQRCFYIPFTRYTYSTAQQSRMPAVRLFKPVLGTAPSSMKVREWQATAWQTKTAPVATPPLLGPVRSLSSPEHSLADFKLADPQNQHVCQQEEALGSNNSTSRCTSLRNTSVKRGRQCCRVRKRG